ncbi:MULTISPECIES: chemotaxis protein CheA [Mesobacillus]|uniref:Chemotaxis protein CheA n=2 Tax=Mesobacillus TaxID=2675231 RepID=A0A0D6Z839_9BACI|nr:MULTISPECIES: chemotaxis protein CheA [Mesobacillus]KIY21520.1 chemotaxis protein CheA [Mesobacillus subterraneus]MDQ0412485.1 two-component system chemotaxis sensor kinase CheA [Mesobacillus stamsii]
MELNQYLEVFIEESREHLQSLNEQLLELEKNPGNLSIINEIFRSAHTLKGMSATMGYEDLASLTHQMENVLDAIRNNRLLTTPEIIDVIFMAVDHLEEMVESIAAGGDGKKDVSETVEKLKAIENGETISRSADVEIAAASTLEAPKSAASYDEFELTVLKQSKEQGFGVYEIEIGLRDDCLLKAARVYMVFEVLEKIGEVIKANPSVEQLEEEQFEDEFSVTIITKENPDDIKGKIMKVSEVVKTTVHPVDFSEMNSGVAIKAAEKIIGVDTSKSLDTDARSIITGIETAAVQDSKTSVKQQTNSSKTIRVNIERLDILMNLFEELVIDRGRLEQISKELDNGELTETVERMSRISGDLQNIILNMRMVQVETVFNRFPRMIRQLAKDLNKKINLEIVGAETELDRTVIDEIGDPLVHLLRNSVDHGIESPEVRRSKGKNEEGTIVLRAFHSGNHVFIEIEDDGAGISKEKVLQKAISKGIITEQSAAGFTDKQAYELILSSGFSTAETISDISGRGVGLDVVKNTIESLGGSISIDSKENEGTIFSIQLPLTLSIISVMLVEIQKEKFAIPLSSIIETAIIKDTEILNAHNQKVIDFRGKVVPLLFLKDIFDVPFEGADDHFHSVIIVRKGDKMAGLIVDSFIGQQEVVLKSLGNYLTDVFAISGATILGDGQVALVVDCNALIK